MGAQRTDFQRLDGQFQVINGAGGRSKMENVVQLSININIFSYVVLNEFKFFIPGKMDNIVDVSGKEIVDADDFMAFLYQFIAKVTS